MSAATALRPPADPESAPFWEGAGRGQLCVQRCPVSGRLIHPPRAFSPFHPGAVPEWATVSGRGTLWSFVVPHPPLLEPFDRLAPYNVILVALDEDPSIRLVGNLVARAGGAIDEIDPSTLRIGARVRAVFERVSDDFYLPRWVLSEE